MLETLLSGPGLFVIALNVLALLALRYADAVEALWRRRRHERTSRRRLEQMLADSGPAVDDGRRELLDSLRGAMRRHAGDACSTTRGKPLPQAASTRRRPVAKAAGSAGTRIDAPSLRIRA